MLKSPSIVLLAALLTLSGCDSDPALPTDAGSIDAGSIDAGSIDGGTSGCSATDLAACEYQPDSTFSPGTEAQRTVSYTDESGQVRSVAFEVRLTEATARPAPVVVWSHGGPTGKRDPAVVGTGFSDVFREGGYAVIAIAHTPRSRTEYAALCRAVGITGCMEACGVSAECTTGGATGTCVDGGCRYWKHLNWDRSFDVRAVLDWLEESTASGMPLEAIIDSTRIVYAGHSAGGGSSMMVAGATREFAGTQRLLMDPRPLAFISCSPQGPGDDGFVEGSFTGEFCRGLATDPSLCLTRPHLFLTGIGDDTAAHVAENRRRSFELAPMTGTHLIGWVDDEAARHTTFNYETAACERYAATEGLDAARCAEHLVWLRSAALAFLDATVRDSARARAYLGASDLTILSGGVFSLTSR